MTDFAALIMFAVTCIVLLAGFPVAFSLAGTALIFAGAASLTGHFDFWLMSALPSRLFGIITNQTLMAVPLFVFMGVMLEKSRIAENLLESMTALFGKVRGGMGLSVTIVGMLLAASTGIVGATVVTMGLLSLPCMLRHGYSAKLATGTICATGSLGQIIPPSIALVLLGDVLSSAYQQSQIKMGIFSPDTVSVGDLFVGAIIPGLVLVAAYSIYLMITAWLKPESAPALTQQDLNKLGNKDPLWISLLPPLALIMAVPGSILAGAATPTEAAGVGAAGATVLALIRRQLSIKTLAEVACSTTKVSCMVFLILIGASIFSLVFRGFNGDAVIHSLFESMPGGVFMAVFVVMLVMFLLGFILDFIEITFVIVPMVGPVLLAMGLDPVWLGIMIAVNLQTSFLTPPFGFALFYLRGVAPAEVATADMYKGVIPFVVIQLLVLCLLAAWPQLATWLPNQL